MKFLKALGIGVATQLSVTILSVILLLACCSVSPGGASVILSGVVTLCVYIWFYFNYKKPNVGKAFYWLSFAFIPLVIHTIFMAFVYTHCEKDVAEALSRGTWFPALNYMPFVTMMPALVVITVTTFITGFYELLDAKIKDRNIPDSTSDTHKGADKNDDSL
jgi:glucan phosphoethanolaminetransferase (alkaline phosphatase superfamily)